MAPPLGADAGLAALELLDAAPEPDGVFAPLVVADPDEASLDDDADDFSLLVELSDLVDFELEPESVL